MAKIISAGILVKCKNKYIIGHVTNNEHYDIFKGKHEEDETVLQTAIRECVEESSIRFVGSQLKYLGLHEYTKKKNLAIFIGRNDYIEVNNLFCAINDDGEPEMDGYELVSFEEMLSKVSKNMRERLKFLEKDIKSF